MIPVGGPVGSAHAIKLINNLVALGYAAIWSECYAMVEKIGIEPGVLREVVTNSGMNCGNFQNFSKYAVEGDPNAHKFSIANACKDLTYYTRLAERARGGDADVGRRAADAEARRWRWGSASATCRRWSTSCAGAERARTAGLAAALHEEGAGEDEGEAGEAARGHVADGEAEEAEVVGERARRRAGRRSRRR